MVASSGSAGTKRSGTVNAGTDWNSRSFVSNFPGYGYSVVIGPRQYLSLTEKERITISKSDKTKY